jgi:hypothetical protein
MSATLEVLIVDKPLDAVEHALLQRAYQGALRSSHEPSLICRLVFRISEDGSAIEPFIKGGSLDSLLRFSGRRLRKGMEYLRPLIECALLFAAIVDVRFKDETKPMESLPVSKTSIDEFVGLRRLVLNHRYQITAAVQWFVVREIEAKLLRPVPVNQGLQQATHFYKNVWINTTRAEIATSVAMALIESEGAIVLDRGIVEHESPPSNYDGNPHIVQSGHVYFSDADS